MFKKKLIGLCSITAVVAIAGTYAYTKNTDKDFVAEFEEDQYKAESTKGASSGIKIPGYDTLYFPYGITEVEVDFFNPEENDVYFELELVITNTGETIYKSKLISPGQHLYNISLDKTLEKGTYDMSIIYSTYSMDESYIPKNGATVSCELVVQ